jgi:hypothetical protein
MNIDETASDVSIEADVEKALENFDLGVRFSPNPGRALIDGPQPWQVVLDLARLLLFEE